MGWSSTSVSWINVDSSFSFAYERHCVKFHEVCIFTFSHSSSNLCMVCSSEEMTCHHLVIRLLELTRYFLLTTISDSSIVVNFEIACLTVDDEQALRVPQIFLFLGMASLVLTCPSLCEGLL